MKVLILVSLLIFAAQAAVVDTTSYVLGFTHQFGLPIEEVTSGLSCFTAVNDTIIDYARLKSLVNGTADEINTAVMNLMATIEGSLLQNCKAFETDLVDYIVENTNVTDRADAEALVKQNAKIYAFQLIEQLTIWIDAFTSHNDYEAGTTEAYIIQILFGIEKPPKIDRPEIDPSDMVPFDAQKYIADFTKAYYNSLGAEDEATSLAAVQCFNNVIIAAPAIKEFIQDFEQAHDIIAKVEVFRTAIDDLDFVVQACTPVVEFDVNLFAPVYNYLKDDPYATTLTILNNIASHLTELEQSNVDQDTDVLTGDYTGAGLLAAGDVTTIFDKVGF